MGATATMVSTLLLKPQMTFFINVALFKREVHKVSKHKRFIAEKHC